MSQAAAIKESIALMRKTIPGFTNVATTDQASQNARATIEALNLLADVVETQLAQLDARVTALE